MINLISSGDLDYGIVKRYVCDTKEDFAELPVVAENSTVTILSTGETYKIDAEGNWKLDSIMGGEGGVGIPGEKGDKGDPGEKGEPGADGYTPEKGVDYWTEEDKLEMINAVISSKPIKPTFDAERNFIFCNGVGVIVEDNGSENVITYYLDVDSIETLKAPYGCVIYGGGNGEKNAISHPASSIVINNGKIKGVIGGGRGGAHVGSASIVVNGGEFEEGIYGGGVNNITTDDATGNTVGVVHMVINNGSANMIYGGGATGLCQVGAVHMELNGGKGNYLVPAGSNGYTGSATVTVNNGEFTVFQPTGNGSIGSVIMNVNGGIIDRMYCGGIAGTKVGKTTVKISGGQINKLGQGSSNDGTANHISGSYVSGVIKNEEIAESLNLVKVPTLEETIKRLIAVEQTVTVTDIEI